MPSNPSINLNEPMNVILPEKPVLVHSKLGNWDYSNEFMEPISQMNTSRTVLRTDMGRSEMRPSTETMMYQRMNDMNRMSPVRMGSNQYESNFNRSDGFTRSPVRMMDQNRTMDRSGAMPTNILNYDQRGGMNRMSEPMRMEPGYSYTMYPQDMMGGSRTMPSYSTGMSDLSRRGTESLRPYSRNESMMPMTTNRVESIMPMTTNRNESMMPMMGQAQNVMSMPTGDGFTSNSGMFGTNMMDPKTMMSKPGMMQNMGSMTDSKMQQAEMMGMMAKPMMGTSSMGNTMGTQNLMSGMGTQNLMSSMGNKNMMGTMMGTSGVGNMMGTQNMMSGMGTQNLMSTMGPKNMMGGSNMMDPMMKGMTGTSGGKTDSMMEEARMLGITGTMMPKSTNKPTVGQTLMNGSGQMLSGQSMGGPMMTGPVMGSQMNPEKMVSSAMQAQTRPYSY
jgi:hypothetical protein